MVQVAEVSVRSKLILMMRCPDSLSELQVPGVSPLGKDGAVRVAHLDVGHPVHVLGGDVAPDVVVVALEREGDRLVDHHVAVLLHVEEDVHVVDAPVLGLRLGSRSGQEGEAAHDERPGPRAAAGAHGRRRARGARRIGAHFLSLLGAARRLGAGASARPRPDLPASCSPQLGQNFEPAGSVASHFGQVTVAERLAPQSGQNLLP